MLLKIFPKIIFDMTYIDQSCRTPWDERSSAFRFLDPVPANTARMIIHFITLSTHSVSQWVCLLYITLAASSPCSCVTTDLLRLHKERFDTVTLVQKHVYGKKVLFLTVEAPTDDVKKKEAEGAQGGRRASRRGRKPFGRGSGWRRQLLNPFPPPYSPSLPPPPPPVPDSPLGWFGNIPHLDKTAASRHSPAASSCRSAASRRSPITGCCSPAATSHRPLFMTSCWLPTGAAVALPQAAATPPQAATAPLQWEAEVPVPLEAAAPLREEEKSYDEEETSATSSPAAVPREAAAPLPKEYVAFIDELMEKQHNAMQTKVQAPEEIISNRI